MTFVDIYHILLRTFAEIGHIFLRSLRNVGFDMSCHAAIKTPRSGLLRGGGWGCYAESQAMRAWASASTAAQRELMLASTASLAAARSALGALWAKR